MYNIVCPAYVVLYTHFWVCNYSKRKSYIWWYCEFAFWLLLQKNVRTCLKWVMILQSLDFLPFFMIWGNIAYVALLKTFVCEKKLLNFWVSQSRVWHFKIFDSSQCGFTKCPVIMIVCLFTWCSRYFKKTQTDANTQQCTHLLQEHLRLLYLWLYSIQFPACLWMRCL